MSELIKKEAVFLFLVAVLSATFYYGVEDYATYVGFVLLGLAFYMYAHGEEKKVGKEKKVHNYFHHESSHFITSSVFFLASYGFAMAGSWFVYVTLTIAVLMFSLGVTSLFMVRSMT